MSVFGLHLLPINAKRIVEREKCPQRNRPRFYCTRGNSAVALGTKCPVASQHRVFIRGDSPHQEGDQPRSSNSPSVRRIRSRYGLAVESTSRNVSSSSSAKRNRPSSKPVHCRKNSSPKNPRLPLTRLFASKTLFTLDPFCRRYKTPITLRAQQLPLNSDENSRRDSATRDPLFPKRERRSTEEVNLSGTKDCCWTSLWRVSPVSMASKLRGRRRSKPCFLFFA